MKIATFTLLGVLVVSPVVSLYPEPAQRDVPAEVESAKRSLEGAYNDLEHAGGQWGGHRVAAMKHIQQAMAELSEAEKWAASTTILGKRPSRNEYDERSFLTNSGEFQRSARELGFMRTC